MNRKQSSRKKPDILRVLQSKSDIRAYYNKIAKVYDLLSERSERPMRQAGLKMLDLVPGESVLEIGFGTGHCLVDLARAAGKSGKVFGVDLSENMIARTRRLLDQEGLSARVRLACCDAEFLPFASGRMDALFVSFALEIFDTPAIPKVLAEWLRVLKPGGRMVVVAVSKAGKTGVVVNIYEWTHRHFPNLLDCRPIYVRKAMQEAGFTIRESRLEKMWVPVEIVLGEKPG